MSNKRRRRNAATENYFVYEPGVTVPRDVTHLLVSPSVRVLPKRALKRLKRLKEVVLPEGLLEIGTDSFKKCKALKHLNLPSSLVRIRDGAFEECTSLTRLEFPEGLVEIGNGAFHLCSSLKSVCFSSTVTSVDMYAFSGCLLKSVTLVDGIQSLGEEAFLGCPLKDLVLPTSLNAIGECAFASCKSIERLKFSGGIQLIEHGAFDGAFDDGDCCKHIETAPKCLVVRNTGDVYHVEFLTDLTILFDDDSMGRFLLDDYCGEQLLIASECFFSMPPAAMSALKTVIAGILGTERLKIDWKNKYERLRGLLAPHERRHKKEVTSILELGLWKAAMAGGDERIPGTREECRVTCGADTVIRNVVPFL